MAKFKIWVHDGVEREFDSKEDAISWLNFISPTEQGASCVITGKGEYAPKAESKSLPTADLPETVVVKMPRARRDSDGEFSYYYHDVQISLETLAEKLAPILFDHEKLGEKLGRWLNDREQQKLSNRMMEYVDDKLHPISDQWSRQEQWEIFYQVRAERDRYKAERDMFKSLYEVSIGGKSFLSHR